MPYKIRTKLIIAFFAVIFPFIIVVSAIALYNTNAIRKASLKVETISEELHLVLSLQIAIDKALMPGNDYIITGDRKYIDEFNAASKDVEELIKKVEETLITLKGMEASEVREGAEIFKSVRAAWQNIKEISQKIFEIQNPVGNKDAVTLMEEMDYKWAYPAIKMLDNYHEIDRKKHDDAVKELQRVWMMVWVIMVGGAVILIIFGVFFVLFYSRLFTTPIQTIHNGADEIAKGNFKTRLNIKTGDELQQLSDAMNEMAAQLVHYYGTLERRVEERTRELRESEEKYRAVFSEALDGIVLIDKESGFIVDCNPEFERQTGRRIEELKKMKIWELRPAENIEVARQKFLEIVSRGEGGSRELGFQRPDGEIVPIEFLTKKIMIQGREYLHSFVRDITERKKAEEKIKEQLDYLERFHKVAVKREFRIKELKDENDMLKAKISELEKRRG